MPEDVDYPLFRSFILNLLRLERVIPDENGQLISKENFSKHRTFEREWSRANEAQFSKNSPDRIKYAVLDLLDEIDVCLNQDTYDAKIIGPKLQEWLEKRFEGKYRLYIFRDKKRYWWSDVADPVKRKTIFIADEGAGYRPVQSIPSYIKRQDWCEYCDVYDISHKSVCPYLAEKYGVHEPRGLRRVYCADKSCML